jgi:hypothetical protein
VHRPTTKRLDHGDFERSQITGEAETSDGFGKAIQSNRTGSGVAKERSATVRPLWVKNATSGTIQVMSVLTPITDIG